MQKRYCQHRVCFEWTQNQQWCELINQHPQGNGHCLLYCLGHPTGNNEGNTAHTHCENSPASKAQTFLIIQNLLEIKMHPKCQSMKSLQQLSTQAKPHSQELWSATLAHRWSPSWVNNSKFRNKHRIIACAFPVHSTCCLHLLENFIQIRCLPPNRTDSNRQHTQLEVKCGWRIQFLNTEAYWKC